MIKTKQNKIQNSKLTNPLFPKTLRRVNDKNFISLI